MGIAVGAGMAGQAIHVGMGGWSVSFRVDQPSTGGALGARSMTGEAKGPAALGRSRNIRRGAQVANEAGAVFLTETKLS